MSNICRQRKGENNSLRGKKWDSFMEMNRPLRGHLENEEFLGQSEKAHSRQKEEKWKKGTEMREGIAVSGNSKFPRT